MTKSRTPLILLAPLAAAWPGGASAEPDQASAEEMVAAYEARIHAAMGSVDGVRRCPRGDSADDAIVVCGRSDDPRMRLPLGSQPEAGARRRLIAGEPPSAVGALSVGQACCGGGGGINLIGLARVLGRGAGRILHPRLDCPTARTAARARCRRRGSPGRRSPRRSRPHGCGPRASCRRCSRRPRAAR